MRKNIYIRDEDQELFDRAEKLFGDNFSGLVAEAVRRFVEVEEAKADGMEEQEIEVGVYYSGTSSNDTRKIKFIGKKIADARLLLGQTSSRDDRGKDYTLYLTKKGKFLLHTENWSKWEGEDGESTYDTFESMTHLISYDPPGSLIQEAGKRLGIDTAEYLDI